MKLTPNTDFLQSQAWADFQAKQGRQVATITLEESGGRTIFGYGTQKIGVLSWYFPRVALTLAEARYLQTWVQQTGAAWWHVDPLIELDLGELGGTMVKPRQPRATWMLDLQTDEAALLAAMHPKTRYNINLAARKGVEVRAGADVALFNRLMHETAARDTFVSYPAAYYRGFLQIPGVTQLTAWHNGQALATGLFMQHNDTYTYVHGASHHAGRAVMAPQALQWAAIGVAKQRGCTQYDFWGIAPPASDQDSETFHEYTWHKHDSLAGVTRFKVGFGGRAVVYPPAWQIILKPRVHGLYSLMRKIV